MISKTLKIFVDQLQSEHFNIIIETNSVLLIYQQSQF